MSEIFEIDEELAVESTIGTEGSTGSSTRIFCANCIHCKLVPAASHVQEQYVLRVRCDKGMWRKKLGEEKIYKYFTVARRSISECEQYVDMGEPAEFIRDLKKSLPIKDELYAYQGGEQL